MFKLDLKKAEEPEIRLPTSVGSSISKRDPEKIYFCFIDYANAFDCVDHNKLWKALQEMGIPDHMTCLLQNLYPCQEATVRTGHGITVQFSSVVQSCPTLRDPMNHGTPGLPVHHQLLEFTQIHVHRVGDAIQPSHLLSSPSPPAPNPSQDQDLFQ